MRTIWNGSLSFGLVAIPVGLAVAQQRQDVSFRTLHRECGSPIKQKRWCPVHERELEADELVKGWEFAKGQYVVVEDVRPRGGGAATLPLDRAAPLRAARRGRPHLLRPRATTSRRRATRSAGGRTPCSYGRSRRPAWPPSGGSCSGARRTSASFAPVEGALVLELLYYAEDIRARAEIAEAVGGDRDQEARSSRWRASSSRASSDSFDPGDYRNTYRDELRAMLDAKLAGEAVVRPAPLAEAPVIDLMEALRQSVAATKAAGAAQEPPRGRRAAARSRR